MKLYETKSDIAAAIKSIATRGKRLDRDIHVAAVSALQHNDKHGDPVFINALIDAMPKGSRVNALRAFIEAFGKVRYDAENKAFAFDKKGVTLLQDAIENVWTDFKPEPEYKPLDLNAAVAALLERANKSLENGEKRDKIDTVTLKALQEVAARVAA